MYRITLLTLALGVYLLTAGIARTTIYKFDMGPANTPVFEGFTQITEKSVYTPASKLGWRAEPGAAGLNRLPGVPDPLCCDYVAPGKGFSTYYLGQMEFLLDVPNGEYMVWCITSDYNLAPLKAYSIGANGEAKVTVKLSDDDWEKQEQYRHLNDDYRKSDNIWDKYFAPRFAPAIFKTEVKDGQLKLAFRDTPVQALVVYPVAEAREAEEFLKTLDQKRRAAFPYKDATPRPTAEEKDAFAKSLPADAKEKGYLLFFPHYQDRVFPFNLPKPEQLDKGLRVFAALGEFEPATFAVHPLKDLGQCTVTVSDMAADNGATLPATAWSVTYVRYLEMAQLTPQYHITPQLLMKGVPLPLEADVNRQWWLTVRIPEDAKPGKYKGKVKFQPANGPATDMEMRLLVLPYKLRPLEDNARYTAQFHTYLHWRDIGLETMARDLKDHGFNALVSFPGPQAKLADGKFTFDTKDFEKWLEAYRKAGFPIKRLVAQGYLSQAFSLAKEPLCDEEWLKAHGGHSDHMVKKSFSPQFDEIHKKLAQAMDQLFKQPGWPEVYYYEAGEGGCEGYWGVWTEAHLLKNMFEAGVKGVTSVVGMAALEAELPYLSAVLLSSNDATPEVRDRITEAGKAFWQYGGIGVSDRMNRGFWYWRCGARFTAGEGYAHIYGDPYDEFDGPYAAEGLIWPCPQGVVPSLRYEWMREGIDDAKYISHLDLLAQEALKSEKENVRTAVAEARQTIDGIMDEINPDPNGLAQQGDPPIGSLDIWRWKIADQITKLMAAMQQK